jgi:hypothetical protein
MGGSHGSSLERRKRGKEERQGGGLRRHGELLGEGEAGCYGGRLNRAAPLFDGCCSREKKTDVRRKQEEGEEKRRERKENKGREGKKKTKKKKRKIFPNLKIS